MVTVKFNDEWVKSVTKKVFMDNEKHHADTIDLSAYYDSVVPPKEKATAKTEAKEPVIGD